MFQYESFYASYRRRFGVEASRYFLWLLPEKESAPLKSPKENSGYEPINWRQRWIFEINDHFLEISNARYELQMVGGWILFFTVVALAISGWMGVLAGWFPLLMGHYPGEPNAPIEWGVTTVALIIFTSMFTGVAWFTWYFLWPAFIRPSCFTMRRGRIRFNRDTRKVYALRPKFCGGNVVLDWDRVMAQVQWYVPNDMAVESRSKKFKLEAVQKKLLFQDRSLVLYWPPLDPNDPEAKGEEALFVGPSVWGNCAGFTWEYIRRYMEIGPNAVEHPAEDNLLVRGFWDVDDCMQMQREPFKLYAASAESSDPGAIRREILANTVMTPVNLIPGLMSYFAQFLCYWPKFPKEWNSDSGLGID